LTQSNVIKLLAYWYAHQLLNKTVMKRFEAAYVKCVKVFFGFARLDSVTSMFCELGLPTFNTVLHNAKFSLKSSAKSHKNIIVRLNYEICVVNRC